jgi:hypothetical protein
MDHANATMRRPIPATRPGSRLRPWVLGGLLCACSSSEHDAEGPVPPTPTAAAPAAELDPLDAEIAEHWRVAAVEPVAVADDAAFLRRVTLDLAGRIPTADEVERFLSANSPDKRPALVDSLLGSDAFTEHWADVLADTLLRGSTLDRPRLRTGLHAWLAGELEAGTGWDEITTQLLGVEGDVELEGPAGFLVAHGRGGQVEALTGQTARVFLGLQVQCAQCHDDPDGRFTQREFYGLAAYYARTRGGLRDVDGERRARIVDRRRGELHMPTAQDAPGERTGEVVLPGFPGLDAVPHERESRRQALARGVIASPLFAKAAVNHVWAQLLGRGVVEPWDDLGTPQGSEHPPLLDWLAEDFVAHDHDLRHLLRRIVLSSAYQRGSIGAPEGTAAREQAFAQAAVRPLDAAPLVRSLLVATGLEDVRGRAFARDVERRLRQVEQEFAQAFDDDEGAAADTFTGNVPQALLLLDGELTNQGVAAPRGALAHVLRSTSRPEDRVDALWLRVYGRPAPPPARADALAFLDARDHDDAAYQDLMHAMLMTSEFLTNH